MDDMSYIQFLCHEGYNETDIGGLIGQGPVNCSEFVHTTGEDALNYPTMQLTLRSNKEPTTGNFRRTVTNVGPPQSVYNATIKAPAGVEIVVQPMSLSFSKASQKRSFKVVVKAKPVSKNVMILSGSLTWKSSGHTVRSPIVIYNQWAEQDMELGEGDLIKSQ
ncbi:xylem serine proteinase 1 [Phtheirospermum japonicum]|uniref:Xylem serine proteinase 1 n=1 Tax=Phtheirospermum japonicum TaxID=374723 RepID=A0A830BN76_9LAMI|nr:xylem serine proteinase 1 [Phtheirospermum japonicum]